MVRLKSEDRRLALLGAATQVIAEHGLSASTSLISKTAGVSEGSLFTYFATKEVLINELYRHLRSDLASVVMKNFPSSVGLQDRLRHIWNNYVDWGVDHSDKHRALRLVSMSNLITPDVRAESTILFAEVNVMEAEALDHHAFRQIPMKMVSRALKALAEMTMELIQKEPEQREFYMQRGFDMLWGALSTGKC